MSKKDKGHYADKHPKGTKPDEAIAQAVANRLSSGRLSCAEATAISDDLDVAMLDVGTTADLLEIKIVDCDLGLLGCNRSQTQDSGNSAAAVPVKLKESIQKAQKQGRLSCQAAWDIAKELGCARLEVGRACDALNVRISPCQLGAF